MIVSYCEVQSMNYKWAYESISSGRLKSTMIGGTMSKCILLGAAILAAIVSFAQPVFAGSIVAVPAGDFPASSGSYTFADSDPDYWSTGTKVITFSSNPTITATFVNNGFGGGTVNITDGTNTANLTRSSLLPNSTPFGSYTLWCGTDWANIASFSSAVIAFAFGGADTITGSGSADFIFGGLGSDSLHGQNGDDQIWGGPDADTLYGDAGYDVLHLGPGSNQAAYGGSGVDTIWGSSSADT